MKRFFSSMTGRVFACIFAALAILMLVQNIVMRNGFLEYYRNSYIKMLDDKFSEACSRFDPAKPYSNGSALHTYSLETGSPVLVLDLDCNIIGTDFPDCLDKLIINLDGYGFIKLNISYLYKFVADASTELAYGSPIKVKAVRLGNSDYYEPLTIVSDRDTYSNRASIQKYGRAKDAASYIEGTGTVQRLRFAPTAQYSKNMLAGYIYEAAKDLLIDHSDVAASFEALRNSEFTGENGDTYRLLCSQHVASGKMYYFLTAAQIQVSGMEVSYVNRYMIFIYVLMGLFLTVAALIISKMITRPLKQLQTVTRQFAQLDFSQKARIGSSDELGMLAADINSMSDSLQKALASLIKTNADLEEAMREAMCNAERMKTMLANLAHEFKTPLSIISAYLQALQSGIYASPSDCYTTIFREIDQLAAMVNDAIDLSRLEAGLWKFNPGPVMLRELIEAVIAPFVPIAAERGMELELSAPTACVYADSSRLEQALKNLLGNAVKYGAQNSKILIAVSKRRGKAYLRVANAGHISSSKLPHIWERFTTEGTRDFMFPSDGLGLEITKEILAMHGTTVVVNQMRNMVVFSFSLQLTDPGGLS